MEKPPAIYLSATPADLGACRDFVRERLEILGWRVLSRERYPAETTATRKLLHKDFAACTAVLHIAGVCAGEEPERELGEARRSFTQLEYDLARELGLPLHVFLCAEDFPYDAHYKESEAARDLQQEHRTALGQGAAIIRGKEDLARELHARFELSPAVTGPAEPPVIESRHPAEATVVGEEPPMPSAPLPGPPPAAPEPELQSPVEPISPSPEPEPLPKLSAAFPSATDDDLSDDFTVELPKERRITAPNHGLYWKVALGLAVIALGIVLAKLPKKPGPAGNSGPSATPPPAPTPEASWNDRASDLFRSAQAALRAGDDPAAAALLQQLRALPAAPSDKDARHLLADATGDLATLRQKAGDASGAEALTREALAMSESAGGPDDPVTLRQVHNLAALLYLRRDYTQAEPLYQRALTARERTLGRDAPETLRTAYNLALLCEADGRRAEAVNFAGRTASAARRTLPAQNADRLDYEAYFARVKEPAPSTPAPQPTTPAKQPAPTATPQPGKAKRR